MDASTPQQPEKPIAELQNEPTAEQPILPAWHKPAITRIDIKRTMNAVGSGMDFSGITAG